MRIRDKLSPGDFRKPEKKASTAERLQTAIDMRQIKQADLARSTGISRGAISNYVQGRYEPKSDIIQKLANALNCSEMWLWGYDVPMERANNLDEENPYALEISDILDTLEVDNQKILCDFVKTFARNPEIIKKSLSDNAITEGELLMLELFRQIPEDQQKVFLEMGRVYANSLKTD